MNTKYIIPYALNKVYKCSNQIIEDKLCLIYLDAYEGEEGIKVEFNYFDESGIIIPTDRDSMGDQPIRHHDPALV